ncbi:MAG: putative DNA modification/repair radical SAM protein [Lachnospiraceae bacterium]|nr:putative DNA modification/repair radical SAM protein [Lachnospiraceae bacterium]
MLVVEDLSVEQKLEILSDAAKYDVACTSSGVERKGKEGMIGNTAASGICHSFAADGRCISLLKILFTNECIHDCKYCINRRSNDTLRTSFTPEEVCELTIQFYRRNYIEGLFLSSGVRRSPDETMEQIYITLKLLREKYKFNGYIHVKGIPGASPQLVEAVGFLADRMSLNLELATADGLKKLAPGKSREKILLPMRQIQKGIYGQRMLLTDGKGDSRPALPLYESEYETEESACVDSPGALAVGGAHYPDRKKKQDFVPAGQSTQMIVGATQENDYQLLTVAESLYQNYDLKRVFYSAYVALNEDSALPDPGTKPPLLREHRLYQADWLLRFYGFKAQELLSEEKPNFNVYLDPKCEWAIRHLEHFPVEINRAPYGLLLRVPGIGVKSARRIVRARRSSKLDFEQLRRIGVVLKRAHYFITCNGKMMYRTKIDEDYITRRILDLDRQKNWEMDYNVTFRQLSLFDDRSFLIENRAQ